MSNNLAETRVFPDSWIATLGQGPDRLQRERARLSRSTNVYLIYCCLLPNLQPPKLTIVIVVIHMMYTRPYIAKFAYFYSILSSPSKLLLPPQPRRRSYTPLAALEALRDVVYYRDYSVTVRAQY